MSVACVYIQGGGGGYLVFGFWFVECLEVLYVYVVRLFLSTITFTRARIAKRMTSMEKRSVVNTGMAMGKASGKAVASVSNGFAVGMSSGGKALTISFVNCGAGRIGVNRGTHLRVILRRSARALSRIMIMNCNARAGGDLAKTVDSIGSSTLAHSISAAATKTLSNGVTNMSAHTISTHPNEKVGLRVHGVNDPLFMVSNVPCKNVGDHS